MATHIDPEKEAKYPIVLSDALMGRGTKEVITGIRCMNPHPIPQLPQLTSFADNHKPTESSNSSLKNTLLRPTSPSDSDTYDLSFADDSGKYDYQGSRNTGDGQYALIFDPVKKQFVLHQVDSSFNMNLTGVPWPHEPDSLRDTYEQLQTSSKLRRKSASTQRTRAAKDNAAKENLTDIRRRKVEKPKKKPPPREPTPDAEDEDSDDGLTIEYPGGKPPSRFGIRSSPVPMRQVEEEPVSEESDADADFEEDDNGPNDDVDMLQLPSPVANAADDDMDDDLELDLEAELELELEKQTGGGQDESSESEED